MKGMRWKWLEEKGFDVLSDKHQYAYMQSLWAPVENVQGVFCEARAGTGKTSLATLAGAYEVDKGTYEKIIYCRNAVSIRDQGFLPGDDKEKSLPYMAPFIESLDKVQPGYYDKFSKPNPLTKAPAKVVTTTTSFTRGVTWDNAFVIVDEAQNMEAHELQAIYTRCTDRCKIVTIGSLRQVDNTKLKRFGGLTPFEAYMEHFKGTNVTYHKLEKNYRGWFSDHADNILETIERLRNGGSL